jgi:hypothetical protein
MTFKVGDKVMCVKGGIHGGGGITKPRIEKGHIYVVSKSQGPNVSLEGVPLCEQNGRPYSWTSSRFKLVPDPIKELKYGILALT